MASTSSQPPRKSWSSDPVPSAGHPSRKALPIKKDDSQPLFRDDIQYDLLEYIFSDGNRVFTSPTPGKTKVNFRELYVDALYNSTKCSKVLKDKMTETPAFAIELAKISLLTNVGRINTTMAFFPEMKTALRTYHPVPSLQKTDGNAQDAPRIKNCLKAALLPSEFRSIPPSTPEEILKKTRSGQIPSTSVVNLIFVLSNHATPLASVHFDNSLNFYDLFLPRKLSSAGRARAFLWLIYHYLEGPEKDNPFHDDHSRKNPNKVPLIPSLSDAEMREQNVDSPEEIEWGGKMSTQRHVFLRRLVSSTEDPRRGRTREISSASQAPDTEHQRSQQRHPRQAPQQQHPQWQRGCVGADGRASQSAGQPGIQSTYSQHGSVGPSTSAAGVTAQVPHATQRVGTHERTMLQHAWHAVTTTDPLLDSDEENHDEHSRLDYNLMSSDGYAGALPILKTHHKDRSDDER